MRKAAVRASVYLIDQNRFSSLHFLYEMMKFPSLVLLFLLFNLALQGCGQSGFLSVYKLTIQQGNIISQNSVDRLRLGMTQKQVQFVLGKPILEDVFRNDRLDYVQYIQAPGKEGRVIKLSIFFEDDKLARAEGDFDFSMLDAPLDILEPLPSVAGARREPPEEAPQ